MQDERIPESDAQLDRRAFLDRAGSLGMGGLAAAAAYGGFLPNVAFGQPAAGASHPASAQLLNKLQNSFTFQFSVDVATLNLALTVAAAALAGGVDILEMGTPLLKHEGFVNVVPAFRQRFPNAMLLSDLKSMDGVGGEVRTNFQAGTNICDFLALAGVDSARAACAVRDEFRQRDPSIPRLLFADILIPHQAPAATAVDVAMRMVDAGVDGVGIHLQTDARRASPALLRDEYLGDIARAVFEKVGRVASVQVVGGLYVTQAKKLAASGLRAFVISGNMGVADGQARYNEPPGEIQRLVSRFISETKSQ